MIYTRNNKLLVTSNGHLANECGLSMKLLIDGAISCPANPWPSSCNLLYNNFTLYLTTDYYNMYKDETTSPDWIILLWFSTTGYSDLFTMYTSDVGPWDARYDTMQLDQRAAITYYYDCENYPDRVHTIGGYITLKEGE